MPDDYNTPRRARRWVLPLAAAAAAFAVFIPILGFEFLEYDDLIYVFQSPLARGFSPGALADLFLSPYFRSYSPLTLLTHSLDLVLWGDNGGLHHLLNLLLHAANVVLVFLATERVLGAWTGGVGAARGDPGEGAHGADAGRGGNTIVADGAGAVAVGTGGGAGVTAVAAFAASLLFAVHPLQVEPVAWISGRKDLLMAFFLLAAFLAYVRWREDVGPGEGGRAGGALRGSEGDPEGLPEPGGGAKGSRRAGVPGGRRGMGSTGTAPATPWLPVSTGLFVLALLSKSTAATFPLVLIVCDRLIFGRRESLRALAGEKRGMLVAAGAAVLVAVLAGKGHDTSDLLAGFHPAARVLLPIFTPAFYLWELVWPAGLTPFTPPAPLAWVFIGAGVTVVVTAALVRRRGSGVLAAWLGFLLLLLPTIGGTFMETGMQPWADRFTYAPMIPVFIAAGAGLSRIPRRYARIAILLAAALGCAVLSRGQLQHWRTTEAVWTRVVQSSPALAKGYKNLGSIRFAQGRTDEAIKLFGEAIALKPAYGEAHNDLGLALAAAGRLDEAIEAHRTAIAVEPGLADGYNGYGIALLRTGDARGAYDVFRRGIDADPVSAKLRYNAGIAALASGDTGAAISRFQETVALDSTAARAAENAAMLLEVRQDPDAARWYERAAAAGSADARAWLAKHVENLEPGRK